MYERHGMSRTPIYKIWHGMKSRCYNPTSTNYERYGGRGIRVCVRWRESFLAFYADMGERPSLEHSIDRIDNEGNYEPDNCRWANRKEQHSNRRDTRHIEFRGETKTLTEWARSLNMSRRTLEARIDESGWSVESALTEPVCK